MRKTPGLLAFALRERCGEVLNQEVAGYSAALRSDDRGHDDSVELLVFRVGDLQRASCALRSTARV
jgi:hypothetical protein